MKRLSLYLLAAVCVALVGCASKNTIVLNSTFNPEEAQRMLQPGINTISGSALIRQNGGGVVNCAGLPVRLIPKTAYALERFRAIYGNTFRGYRAASSLGFIFSPDYPAYQQHTRHTLCDAQGHFTFKDVADGDYLITTTIVWQVANSIQGGALMQAVSVHNGDSQEVVLSP